MISTSFRLRRDQWERLRREAEVIARERRGKPDASAALRRVLDWQWLHPDHEHALPDPEGSPALRALVGTAHRLTRQGDPPTDQELRARVAGVGGAPVTGPQLKLARKALRLSQAALGRKLHVDTGTVSRWERSTKPLKSEVSLAIAALAMAYSPDDLIFGPLPEGGVPNE